MEHCVRGARQHFDVYVGEQKTPQNQNVWAFLKTFPWTYRLFLWYFGSPHGVNQSTRGIVYRSTGRFSKMPKHFDFGGFFVPPHTHQNVDEPPVRSAPKQRYTGHNKVIFDFWFPKPPQTTPNDLPSCCMIV